MSLLYMIIKILISVCLTRSPFNMSCVLDNQQQNHQPLPLYFLICMQLLPQPSGSNVFLIDWSTLVEVDKNIQKKWQIYFQRIRYGTISALIACAKAKKGVP